MTTDLAQQILFVAWLVGFFWLAFSEELRELLHSIRLYFHGLRDCRRTTRMIVSSVINPDGTRDLNYLRGSWTCQVCNALHSQIYPTMNKKQFFDNLRKSGLHTTLSHAQVAGYEEILIYWERTCIGVQIQHLAYILATAYHETGGRIEPVREGFAKTDAGAVAAVAKLFKAGRISKNYALPDKRTGKSYYGRGLAQVTHYDNYKRIGERIGMDLVNDPDLLLLLPVSVQALVIGMVEGLYTGKKLADYITKDETDYRGARRIINGTDKAEMIAGYAVKFESVLREAIA